MLNRLSDREAEVLDVISTGCTNIECGMLLSVGEKTIKHHLTSIYKKLNCKSRLQAILIFLDLRQTNSRERLEASLSNIISYIYANGLEKEDIANLCNLSKSEVNSYINKKSA